MGSAAPRQAPPLAAASREVRRRVRGAPRAASQPPLGPWAPGWSGVLTERLPVFLSAPPLSPSLLYVLRLLAPCPGLPAPPRFPARTFGAGRRRCHSLWSEGRRWRGFRLQPLTDSPPSLEGTGVGLWGQGAFSREGACFQPPFPEHRPPIPRSRTGCGHEPLVGGHTCPTGICKRSSGGRRMEREDWVGD